MAKKKVYFLSFRLLPWTTCGLFSLKTIVRALISLFLLSLPIFIVDSHCSCFIFLVILGNSFASRVISRGSRPTATASTVPGGPRGAEQTLLQVITAQSAPGRVLTLHLQSSALQLFAQTEVGLTTFISL